MTERARHAAGTAQLVSALNATATPDSTITLVDHHDVGHARIERFRLGNGLELIVWEDHTVPVFSYQTWYRVGSRFEQAGRTGISHLFEHLMFKATEQMPEGQFDVEMERRGGQTNAATWVDWTYYKAKLPAGNLDFVQRTEADRMAGLVLNEDQLNSEREVVINERKTRIDNDPEGALYERLYHRAFQTHGYGWPTIGWMDDIKAIELSDCLAFYKSFYAPNNATVVVVGDVDTRDVLAGAQRHYGGLKSQVIPPEPNRAELAQTVERRELMKLPVNAVRLVHGYKCGAAGDPDHAALEILSELLAGQESAPLYRDLVHERELATQVSSWASSWAHPGLFEVSATLQPHASVEDVEARIDHFIAQFRDELVPERQLQKAVNSAEASSLRAAADTGARARGLGHASTTLGDYRQFWKRQQRLRSVTSADVQRVAREVLRPERRTVVVAVAADGAAA